MTELKERVKTRPENVNSYYGMGRIRSVYFTVRHSTVRLRKKEVSTTEIS